MGELDGKVAIVTGAGRLRGIGRSTALALAELGADLVITGTGRNPTTFPLDEKEIGWKDVDSTAEQIRALGQQALPMVVDITSPDQVQVMIDHTIQELGRIDILVNNAAIGRGRDRVPVVDLEQDIFQRVMDVKVLGTYLCSKAVTKILIRQGQGGKIVTVASTAGKRGESSMLAYNAANFAQIGMTQSMAVEFGPHGINVNSVCPGLVDTVRTDDIGRGELWQRMANDTPLRRNGTPEEVGRFIAYLCTEAASWIHGQSINIDGGGVIEH